MNKIILFVSLLLLVSACTEEQQNKISRLGVSWFEGNYKVTYADGTHVKSWVVQNSKITSDSTKGYYYFWVKKNGKNKYVQTPIARTYIEEL
jgi:uncharacterized protein YcfL